jgi:hypothetical protein
MLRPKKGSYFDCLARNDDSTVRSRAATPVPTGGLRQFEPTIHDIWLKVARRRFLGLTCYAINIALKSSRDSSKRRFKME